MGSSRFENEVRKKFEERHIQPSPDAWKKMERMLDVELPKKKSYTYIYMVASLVTALLIGSFFIGNKAENEPKLVIQKNPIKIDVESSEVPPIPSEKIIQPVVEQQPKQEVVATPRIIEEKSKILEEKSEEFSKNVLNPEDEEFLDAWAQQVAASIRELPDAPEDELVGEVENLLADARRKIFLQKTIEHSRVDATALLEEVEWELDKTFRDKIFDYLGDHYDKLRTAISFKYD